MVDEVLRIVKQATSFASSIFPTLGIVSSLVREVGTGLGQAAVHAADQDFQAVHSQLTSISEQNTQCLKQLQNHEINKTFRKYEQRIKHQYEAFTDMVRKVQEDPGNAQCHKDEYIHIYKLDRSDLNLDIFHSGIMGTGMIMIGNPLLKVYLDHCHGDRMIMENLCYYLGYLFQIGLIAVMAYTEAVKNDVDGDTRKMWGERVEEIQETMLEILGQCP